MKDTRTIFEQLEDALLKWGPGGGGAIAAPFVAGLLKDVSPPLFGFMIGGVAGAGFVYILLRAFFLVGNPHRDRSQRNLPECAPSRLSELYEPDVLVRCECGGVIPILFSQAGSAVRCGSCNILVTLPSLGELRSIAGTERRAG